MGEVNDLISPEYCELQKQLHTSQVYGVSGYRRVDDVLAMMAEFKATSVLDYGCGKGIIKSCLGDVIREYDPAVEGKDGPPEEADIVVCTDVLEHIEPEKLDNVLEHIRTLARKAVFVNISTAPAKKILADGRNAHLIVEDADWWRERLAVRFDIDRWEEKAGGVAAVMKPYLTIGEIKSIGAVSNDDRFEQVRQNVKITDRRLKFEPPHNRVAIVMCYGPSLEDTWQSALLELQEIGNADIVSVSGAHDYLLERGVVPRFHIECDPRKHKSGMLTTPNDFTEYLMASCVHPDVFSNLTNKNITLWHLDNGRESFRIGRELEPNALMIGGGGSVGLRALPVMMAKGYRRFIIHGMDCSYREDGSTHAGLHTGKKVQLIEVRCAGRKFVTSPVMLTYLKQFDEFRCAHIGEPTQDPNKIEIILRGSGLLQHAVVTSGFAEIRTAPPENSNKEIAA